MPKTTPSTEAFSVTLAKWLASDSDKTLRALIEIFQEKSFAMIFLLMMALPALPIPTGGVTHVTEIITALAALQLIAGRRIIWLPKRFLDIDVDNMLNGKAAQKLIGVIRWFEKFSRRRGAGILKQKLFLSFTGLIVVVFTVAAFVAPPFSGLDTLPAMGVVIISLALLLEDITFVLGGIILGVAGITLEITAGAELYKGLKHLF